MKYNIYTSNTNLIFNKTNLNYDIKTFTKIQNNYIYKTIFFNKITNKLKDELKEVLKLFINKLNNINHIFIVGIGNDNYTADSIGPKTLKHIKVNSYLKNFINDKIIVSSLEPGVLSETGILTERIIKSISNEIKPDLIILIDSFISSNIDYLNKTIEISNTGISTGIGINNINSNIDENLLNIPIITIGVTTAVEVKFTKEKDINYIPYILSTKDIDKYIDEISKIIGISLNEVIDDLSLH